MNVLATILFSCLWGTIAFVALRIAARRFFCGRYRPEAFAFVVVASFVAGTAWPYFIRTAEGSPSVGPLSAQSVPPEHLLDVSSSCSGFTVSSTKQLGGSIDDVRDVSGTVTAVVPDGGRIDRTRRYILEGWASDGSELEPARSVCLLVDGRPVAGSRSILGYNRPDVAEGYRRDTMMASGYHVEIPPGLLPIGVHTLQVGAVDHGGSFGLLPAKRVVTIH